MIVYAHILRLVSRMYDNIPWWHWQVGIDDSSTEVYTRINMPISWILIRIGSTEVPVPVKNWVLALGDTPGVFISIVIGLLATLQFTTKGSLKTRSALGAAPVKIPFDRTICTPRKAPPHIETPYTVDWWTGGMTSWMIAGIFLFVNNLCGEFTLVVYVAIFGLLLVSLFGLLTASNSSSELLTASTSSLESECAELLIVYWIVNSLKYFIIFAWMTKAIWLSFVMFASLLCALIVAGD